MPSSVDAPVEKRRAVRIFHTSDWHLGRQTADVDRTEDFRSFLTWLLGQISERRPDVLLIAGDIFDTTMPSSDAQRLYYDFLTKASQTALRAVVVTAGNHDSLRFLRAPEVLLSTIRTIVAGNTPETEAVVIRDAAGVPMLGIAAVPYLREGDVRLSGVSDSETDRRRAWENGVRAHYDAVHQKLVEWVGPEVPLVAMGHLFVAGSSVGGAAESVSASSDEADASVYVGSLRNVSAAAFGEGWRYIALGHIHRPQAAAGSNGTAWYCGSPLMLDFGAISDKQQILEVVITDHGVEKHAIHVPQPRILTRISGTLEALQLRLLEVGREAPGAVVEVFFTGAATDANTVVQTLQRSAEHAGVHLAAVRIGTPEGLRGWDMPERRLDDITPEEVFRSVLERSGADDIVREELEPLFAEALEAGRELMREADARRAEIVSDLAGEALIKTTKSMQRRPVMRLLKLRIENINSLAGRYEIDFTNRDYVESGIFAIVGPTGSGKTTILDAVTLALFGKTPRMETRTSTSKKTDRGCMVLTEGRKQCSASVVFESMGKFWRSRWSVRLKRTGEPRDAQVELVRLPDGSAETGEIVAEQKLAWNAKVPEVLGMDYETFTRSALLAQGAFTELLRAQVDDRAAILEKITGTKLYSTIGQWVFERCRDENNKVKRLLVHLEGAEMLAEDARKALETALETTADEAKHVRLRRSELEADLRWIRQATAARVRLKDAEQSFVQAEKAAQASQALKREAAAARSAVEPLAERRRMLDCAASAEAHRREAAQYEAAQVQAQAHQAQAQAAADAARQAALQAAEDEAKTIPELEQMEEKDKCLAIADAEAQASSAALADAQARSLRADAEVQKCAAALKSAEDERRRALGALEMLQGDRELAEHLPAAAAQQRLMPTPKKIV